MHNDETLTKVFDGQDIRIIEGDPRMVILKDVSSAMGYSFPHQVGRHISDRYKGKRSVLTPGGRQEMACTTKKGLLESLFHLSPEDPDLKHQVQSFRDWALEVLVEVLETGSYDMAQSGDGAPSGDLTTLDLAEQMREHQERLDEVEAQQQETTERLADVEQTLEEHRAALISATTRYGHEVKNLTWDGMRTTVNRMVTRYQRTHGGGYSQLYRRLYRQCEKEYGFHPKRVQHHEGGPSGIKALDFDQMRALLQVTRWMYSQSHPRPA